MCARLSSGDRARKPLVRALLTNRVPQRRRRKRRAKEREREEGISTSQQCAEGIASAALGGAERSARRTRRGRRRGTFENAVDDLPVVLEAESREEAERAEIERDDRRNVRLRTRDYRTILSVARLSVSGSASASATLFAETTQEQSTHSRFTIPI